jgi:hypothetical protein
MPNTYTIKVFNESNVTQTYFLFVKPPQVTTQGSPQVFTNVYAKGSTSISGGGVTTFQIEKEFFAVSGVTNPALSQGVVVTTSDSAPIQLGPQGNSGTALVMDGSPGDAANFPPQYISLGCHQDGAYSIHSQGFEASAGGESFELLDQRWLITI